MVSPAVTTTYTLTALGDSPPDAVAQITVGVDVEPHPPVLNEFVADNETGLTDRDGDREDWIEIYNPNPFAIELGGWSLTDNPAVPGKWIFPARVLESRAYLVVFASGKDGPLDVSFRLAGEGEYLALVSPDGDIVQEFAPGYPPQFDDIAFGIPSGGGPAVLLRPTPGAANGSGLSAISPAILGVSHLPLSPGQDEALVVTVQIEPRLGAIDTVSLSYRVGFGREISLPMSRAGGASFSATIPSSSYSAGDMVRWFVTAGTANGETTRSPAFPDPIESAQYHGTVVDDPSITSSLPVLHWFVQNPSASDTRAGTQASLYFAGQFYDNIFC
ncbi:MAG: lamin tail domain-containing protein, partial [Roseibacillus sp.]|nr:lamin tail domain-containing protein [Roseibacillus sp.]